MNEKNYSKIANDNDVLKLNQKLYGKNSDGGIDICPHKFHTELNLMKLVN